IDAVNRIAIRVVAPHADARSAERQLEDGGIHYRERNGRRTDMLAIYLATAFLTGALETDADITINQPVIDVDTQLADQLALRLIRHHDALTAVSLVYTSISERREDQPEGAYWRRAISVSNTGMFKSDNSHGHMRRQWQYDP